MNSHQGYDTCVHNLPPAPPESVLAGVLYTCPLHPEVRLDPVGTCPECGMALESVMPSLPDSESQELNDFQLRFVWTLPLTIT